MPISKRDKKIDLTKVKRKNKDKKDVVKNIRTEIAKYNYVYVLRISNFRNAKLSEMRHELFGSKFIFAKNTLMALAIGKTEDETFMSQMYKLNKYLSGQCCLLLSNKRADELRTIFNTFRSQEYARPGNESPQTVILSEGAVSKLAHTMEPSMRQLGLPVKLVRGVVTLETDYKVCKRGNKLTADQCKILKIFEHQISEFRVSILASWCTDEGVIDHEVPDSFAQITSLHQAVKISCNRLDDGQFYFVPTPIDVQDDKDGEMECNDEEMDIGCDRDEKMMLPKASINRSAGPATTINKKQPAHKMRLGPKASTVKNMAVNMKVKK